MPVELIAKQISVAGTRGSLLPVTTMHALPARVTAIAGDPGPGHAAFALALGGRVPLASGEVLLDGISDQRRQRECVALVDVPEISAPEDGQLVKDVVAAELAFAGRPSRKQHVAAFLDECELGGQADDHFDQLAPQDRIRLLTWSAARRVNTRVLVLAHPDRHGGDPHAWWPILTDLAADGLTVIVDITHPNAEILGLSDYYELGATR